MIYKPEYTWLSDACLNLTDDCNLACRYCFVEQHPHYMTLDIAKSAVDYLVDNLHKKKESGYIGHDTTATVTFFGGEPMLCYNRIIQPLVSYIEQTYPEEVSLSITTNGTLLSRERVQFLHDHKISPLLSIDGAPETQDYNRPCKDCRFSSAEQVMKNIPYLLEYFPDITFRSTIYQPTVEHTFENYVFAQYLGFNNIFMMPNCRSSWTEEQVAILEQEYIKIYDFIIDNFRNGFTPIFCTPINNSFERVLIHDLDVSTDRLMKSTSERQVIRCGLGTGMGSIGYDGSIYGCQEQDSRDKKNIFYIGDIYNGINQEKHEHLLLKYAAADAMKCEDPSYCENCPLLSQCATFACPSTAWDMFGNFHTDAKIHCQWERILFEQAARTMKILVAEDNQSFKHYLYEKCNFNNYWKEDSNG